MNILYWERRMHQELAADPLFLRGYKTAAKGAVLWLAVIIVNLWATSPDMIYQFNSLFFSGLEYSDFLYGITRFIVLFLQLTTLAVVILFAVLMQKGHSWARWLLLVQTIGSVANILYRMLQYGPVNYFRATFSRRICNLEHLFSSLHTWVSLLVPFLLLGLFLSMTGKAANHYSRKLCEIRREMPVDTPIGKEQRG